MSRVAFVNLLSPCPFIRVRLVRRYVVRPGRFQSTRPPRQTSRPSLTSNLSEFYRSREKLRGDPVAIRGGINLIVKLLYDVKYGEHGGRIKQVTIYNIILRRSRETSATLLKTGIQLRVNMMGVATRGLSIS